MGLRDGVLIPESDPRWPVQQGLFHSCNRRAEWLRCVDISHLSPVIPSEASSLKFANGVCTTILDSSLRCAAFRMTEEICAAFGTKGDEGAEFGMTE